AFAPALGSAVVALGVGQRGGCFIGVGTDNRRTCWLPWGLDRYGPDHVCDEHVSGTARNSAGDCVRGVSWPGFFKPGVGARDWRMGGICTAGAGARDGSA